MKRLFANIKHLPTTIAGAAVVASGIIQSPAVQQLATLDPHLAAIVGKAGAIAGGLYLIAGTGGR